MKTFVKFCGMTDPATIAEIPEGGAAGFVVDVPGSPRTLTIDRAVELVAQVSPEVEAWAVVVAPSGDLIRRLFDEVGVDRIQVYGVVPTDLDFLETHHLVPSIAVGVPGAGAPSRPSPPWKASPESTSMPPGSRCPVGAGSVRIGRSAPASSTRIPAASSS